MPRQLFMMLFLLALALPALAMPAMAAKDDSAMAQDCHGMPAQQHDETPADVHILQHGCIGCIAPNFGTVTIAHRPQPIALAIPDPVRKLAGCTPKPRDPPPRF